MAQNRTRAWRRQQRRAHGDDRHRYRPRIRTVFNSKDWKLLYIRRNKLRRARQIGLIWPRREWLPLLQEAEPINVLFICSRNQWRSPTAEKVWSRTPGVNARSAGTSSSARRRVSMADIRWADLICVMEHKHAERIRAEFRAAVRYKDIQVLDIQDDYTFMDADLIELIKAKTEPLIL